MNTRAHTIATITAAALLALTACGTDSTDSTTKPANSSSSSDKKSAALDAEQAVKALANTIAQAKPATVYTAKTDKNNLLGRPGGYTSKADFTDDRAQPNLDDAVQKGGSIEVYDDPADAKERAEFIASTLKKMKIFGTEYHYLNAGTLLRVSGELTPDEAAEYETALNKLG
jgi:maltose-binding protein MalE